MDKVVGGTMRRIETVARDGLAPKSDIAGHIDSLKMGFVALEAKMEAFRAEFSVTVNRVIFVQAVIAGVLFAALKLS